MEKRGIFNYSVILSQHSVQKRDTPGGISRAVVYTSVPGPLSNRPNTKLILDTWVHPRPLSLPAGKPLGEGETYHTLWCHGIKGFSLLFTVHRHQLPPVCPGVHCTPTPPRSPDLPADESGRAPDSSFSPTPGTHTPQPSRPSAHPTKWGGPILTVVREHHSPKIQFTAITANHSKTPLSAEFYSF